VKSSITIQEAQAIVEIWRQEYNNYQPHGLLGYLMSSKFAKQYYENKQAGEITQPGEIDGTLSL